MAMSSSLKECGSEEVGGNDNDDDTDKCFHCVADGEPRPASYFCFNCGVYGRYMCGTCFKLHYRFVKNHETVGIGNKSASNRLDYENMNKMEVEKDLVSKEAEIMQLKEQVNKYSKENQCHQARIKELEITCKNIEKEKIQGEEMAKRNLEHLQNILKEKKAADKYTLRTLLAKNDALQDSESIDMSNKKMHIQLERDKVELQKKFIDFEREANTRIEILMQEMNEKDKALVIKMNELTDVQNEKEDLLLRLSDRKKGNNANIADLSDPNRPTKLAEKYAELYDNEWTDAFAYLQTLDVFKDAEEKHIINTLLAILVEAFTLSTETATKQLDTIRKALEDFYGKNSHKRDQVQALIMQLQDQRKQVPLPRMDLEKEYKVTLSKKIKDLPPSLLESIEFKPFVQKCLELCWLMAIQDPPLYLTLDNCKTGQIFNRNNFKEYTKPGAYVDFVVWPAVFLEKDGLLLCRGVVQCKKSNSFQLRSKDGSQISKRLAKSKYYKDTTVTQTSTLDT